MSKTTRIILSVIYFVLTFALGFFLAFSLPINYFYKLTMEKLGASLDSDPAYAMSLLGGFYDEVPVYYNQEEGIVIFNAVTPIEKDDDNSDYVAGSKVQMGYSIFFYKLKEYQTFSQSTNETKLLVEQENHEYKSIYSILDFDNDDNGTFDEVASKAGYDFIYVELSKGKFDKIRSLELIDKDNNSFRKFVINLDYDQAFFTNSDVLEFYDTYNSDYSQNEKLEEIIQRITKVETYKRSNEENVKAIQNEAGRKPVPYIIIYFVIVYIIWDTLLGFKLLIKLFKLIFGKKKGKQEEEKPREITGDYYSKVTFVLDKEDADTFDGTIIIKYSNEKLGEVEFILNRANAYVSSSRIKAGVYQNLHYEIDDKHTLEGVPENLRVEGFHVDLDVKLKNIESSED